MNNPEDFANSLVNYDDMGDNIRTPVVDNFYSSRRHNNINIISVGHTVTELNVKARENIPSIFITLNSSHLFFERTQEKKKTDCNMHRFKYYKYAIVNYNIVDDYYIVSDKDKNVVYDSRPADIDIEKYIDNTSFNDREYNILSKYLIDRMIEPTYIKPNELFFYFEEYLEFKGKDIPLDFYKIYKKLIGILKEIHSGYFAIFGIVTLIGIGYTYIRKYTNVYNNNNIFKLSLLDIKKVSLY